MNLNTAVCPLFARIVQVLFQNLFTFAHTLFPFAQPLAQFFVSVI